MALVKCPECEKEVSNSAVMCPNCGYAVKVHFDTIKLQEHKKPIEVERQKRKELQDAQRKKQHKNLKKFFKIAFPIIAVFVIGVVVIGVNCKTLESRKIFDNSTAMSIYLRGDWLEDSARPTSTLYRFSDSGLECLHNKLSVFNTGFSIEYYPSQGYIKSNSEEIILNADGTLSSNKGSYKFKRAVAKTSDMESGFEVLNVNLLDVTAIDGSSVKVKGILKNRGQLTYSSMIFLKYDIYDKTNNAAIDSFEQGVFLGDIYLISPGQEVEFEDTISSKKKWKDSYSVKATISGYLSRNDQI